jgi:hypothetical protein
MTNTLEIIEYCNNVNRKVLESVNNDRVMQEREELKNVCYDLGIDCL